MKINQMFIDEYLTAGKTYDNFIFENCPKEVFDFARSSLSKENNGVKSCCVYISREMEEKIEKTLENYNSDIRKKFLVRDFVCALVLKSVLEKEPNKQIQNKIINEQIKAFLDNDFDKVKSFRYSAVYPSDVKKHMGVNRDIELNFFLEETKNKTIQQVINLFISTREPYSVKIFTTNEALPSYVDLGEQRIESPHDYIRKNINHFIESDRRDEREQ